MSTDDRTLKVPQPITVAEFAKKLGLPESSVHMDASGLITITTKMEWADIGALRKSYIALRDSVDGLSGRYWPDDSKELALIHATAVALKALRKQYLELPGLLVDERIALAIHLAYDKREESWTGEDYRVGYDECIRAACTLVCLPRTLWYLIGLAADPDSGWSNDAELWADDVLCGTWKDVEIQTEVVSESKRVF